jgi:aryl-alcohol dehydrogenase-like predicted oxidoreductase
MALAVSEVAEACGLPMAQLALAWVLRQPGITAPIIGASKPHHRDDAVAALGVTLSNEEASGVWRTTSRIRCLGSRRPGA